MLRNGCLLFQNNYAAPGIPFQKPKRRGQPNNAAADDDEIVLRH